MSFSDMIICYKKQHIKSSFLWQNRNNRLVGDIWKNDKKDAIPSNDAIVQCFLKDFMKKEYYYVSEMTQLDVKCRQ